MSYIYELSVSGSYIIAPHRQQLCKLLFEYNAVLAELFHKCAHESISRLYLEW